MKAQGRVLALLAAASCVAVAIAIGVRNTRSTRVETPPMVGSESRVPPASSSSTVSDDGSDMVAARLTPDAMRRTLRKARQMLEQGDASAAESLLVPVVQSTPTAGGWNVLGRVRLALGQTTEAEQAFARACALDSTHAWAHNNLGWIYLEQGDWRGAIPLLEAAVAIDDGVGVFHNNLAVAYERGRRWADAAREYARAVDLQPDHATASRSLARVQTALAQPVAMVEPAPDTTAATPATAVSGGEAKPIARDSELRLEGAAPAPSRDGPQPGSGPGREGQRPGKTRVS